MAAAAAAASISTASLFLVLEATRSARTWMNSSGRGLSPALLDLHRHTHLLHQQLHGDELVSLHRPGQKRQPL